MKRNHITIEYCPTDEMIGDFFTKPLGGAKFCRFLNIIMNLSHDEHGPVQLDEIMQIHQLKMERRMDHDGRYMENNTAGEENEFVGGAKLMELHTLNSQECVGDKIKRYDNRANRSNSAWAAVRASHKNAWGKQRRPTYAEVVAE